MQNKTININTWQNNLDKIILFDNGSYEIKHSTANNKRTLKKHQNCKFYENINNNDTSYFIEDIKEIPLENISNVNKNYSRPISRGLLYDIDLELEIWENILSSNYSKNNEGNSFNENLMIFTHIPFAPDEIVDSYFQIIFEYFGFNACIKAIPHIFTSIYAKERYPEEINPIVQLVVDSGFSSTTIVPIFDNRPIYNAIKRIDISGKLLSNYLKECLLNTIELDLRKEFYLVNLIKEETCYVSRNFNIDMKISSFKDENNINKRTFILPEYRNRTEEQLKRLHKEKWAIEMNSLRFIVPELLFKPNLIGIEEEGLTKGIIQSMNECHKDYENLLLENIIITGGNAKFPNFKDRLNYELYPLIDSSLNNIKIFDFESKVEPVIEGMKLFCRNMETLKDLAIYKSEYDEIGFNVVWKNCL